MSEWISVDEKLPEETNCLGGTWFSDNVLVVEEEGDMYITHYVYPWRNSKCEGWSKHMAPDMEKDKVTHWMPLPAAPEHKGDSDE